MKEIGKNLGLYIHIPFCVRKCKYCDFLSQASTKEMQQQYVEALKKEIRSYKEQAKEYCVRTIYFGGGTPSILDAELVREILQEIRNTFCIATKNVEITLEVNPKTVDAAKWTKYGQMGINRVSIGLQSAQDSELKLLGRVHTFADFCNCYNEARNAGFANISIDIISGLPDQTLEQYTDTLQKVVALEPEHISSYSLIVEEGTKFWDMFGPQTEGEDRLPGEELDRAMYEQTKQFLKAHGYEQYEFSNYAKPGFESKHNSSYWIGVPYLGLGLGSSSYFEGKRYCNVGELSRYLEVSAEQNLRMEQVEKIGKKEAMEEFMFLGLRRTVGVSKREFAKRFGCSMDRVYGTALEKLMGQKVLAVSGDQVRLTPYGVDVSNYVLSEFLLEEGYAEE